MSKGSQSQQNPIEDLKNQLKIERTARENTEQLLKESEQHFLTVVEDMPILFCRFLSDGTLTFVNKKYCQYFGKEVDELLGQKFFQFIPEEDHEIIRQHLSSLNRNTPSITYEHHVLTPDGSMRWQQWTDHALFDEKGNLKEYLSIGMDITEKKEAEKVLSESEERFRLSFQNAPIGMAIVGLDERILQVNQALCDILGYTSEELLTKTVPDITHPDDIEVEKSEKARIIKETGNVIRLEKRYIHATGKIVIGQLSVSLVRGENGEPLYYIGQLEDITERKRAEHELSEKEERYRTLFNLSPSGIILEDRNGVILDVNPAFCDSIGYSRDELVGKKVHIITHPDVAHKVEENIAHLLSGEMLRHLEKSVRKDGTLCYMELNEKKITLPNGEEGILCIANDFTIRKQAEDALVESEQKFRSLADQSPNMIFINQGGKVVYANKKCEELIGYKREEFFAPDFNFLDLVIPEHQEIVLQNFERHQKGEEVEPYEYTLLTKDSKKLNVLISTKLIDYAGGKAILGIVTDITGFKKLEEELLKTEKLESLGVLAGGIAHDFNNLLTGILGNISLAKMYLKPDDKIFELLTAAEKASFRARDLTQQLLTFSKGGMPVKKMVSLKELIIESTNFATRGSKIRPKFNIADDLSTAEVDEGQISQVIHNIVINAVQAMPHGGKLDISARNIELHGEESLPIPKGKYLEIEISDQGTGIPEEFLQRIFDPYFSTKQTGSGLGLATSFSIIKKHNGHIKVQSGLKRGTTFTIYLPASPHISGHSSKQSDGVIRGEGNILIMDDEKIVRDVLGEMLTALGYEVSYAVDGKEALHLYREAKVQGREFEAVIMDLTIPGGMGGEETVRELRKIDPGIPAIVSSGYSTDRVMAEYRNYGFDAVITKPYKVQEVSQVLWKVLHQKAEKA